MNELIEKVETFIRRLHDLEYIITPEAQEFIYTDKKTKKEISLAHMLSRKISEYERNKDNEKMRSFYAESCYSWINRAFTYGVVRERESLARLLQECQDKNVQLANDFEISSFKLKQLQEKMGRFILSDEDLETNL